MKLRVYVNPNPFTSALSALVHGSFDVNIVIRLINSRGTVIRIASSTIIKGENIIKIDNLQRYAAGKYQLQVSLLNGELVETIALVKE